jgi:hypothetical protein
MKTKMFPLLLLSGLVLAAVAWPGTLSAVAAVILGPALLALGLGVSPRLGVLMATTISTTLLDASYDAEYADNSKNLKDLQARVFEASSFDELFTIETTDLTTFRKALSTSNAVTQPYQLAWTPTSTFSFKPAEIPMFDIKIDLEFSSHEVKRSFVGFLHKTGQPQNAQLLTKYLLDELVVPQHIEDVELNGCFAGVYAAPTPGTAGAVGTMMDGVKTVINDAITATTITPIAVGAAPTDAVDFVTWVEDFVKEIDNKDRKRPMTLAMNVTNHILFQEGMRAKYNMAYRAAEDLNRVFHFPNITVMGYAAMGSSAKMFCSPKSNSYKPVNKGNGGNGMLFGWEVEDRRVKVWTDYLMGYGFIDHSRVYTNDSDL